MKQFLFALSMALLLASIITACSQSGVDPTATSTADARIASVTSSSALSGTCVKGASETVVSGSTLPPAVLTYLGTTYPGYTLIQAQQGTNLNGGATYYEVKFTYNGTTQELHFDMTGAVLTATSSGDEGDHEKGGIEGSSSEVMITADKLPAAALAYLSTNFAGYTLVEAEQKMTSTGTVYYEVKFTYNGAPKEIRFDANGALI